MSKTKLLYEDSDNYHRLLAMIDPKQQTWGFSSNDIKAIGWAVDALEVFARRAGAVIVVESSEQLEADNTDELIEAMKEGFAVRLADVEARAEAVKNDFATRLADAEDKAEKYRLALVECRRIIEDGIRWDSVGVAGLHGIIAEALK